MERDISVFMSIFDSMKDRAGALDKIVDHVVKVSHQNEDEINILVSNLKNSLKDIVDTNQKNVTATNQVLDKLPKMLMELQKADLIKYKI